MTIRKDEKYKNVFSPEQRKWIDALKSGKYRKTTGTLMTLTQKDKPKGYCCLGVYCMLSGQKWRSKENWTDNRKAYFGKLQDTELNIAQTRKLKLYGQLGDFKKPRTVKRKMIDHLAELNDSTKMSLAEIGKWIEAHPYVVFKNFEEV